jgi:hypothetical protein
MFWNPAISRSSIYSDCIPSVDEATVPDAMLTLNIIIICLTSPFWLVYLLFKPTAIESGLFTG